jgi:hypothetical protein
MYHRVSEAPRSPFETKSETLSLTNANVVRDADCAVSASVQVAREDESIPSRGWYSFDLYVLRRFEGVSDRVLFGV